MPPDQVQEKVSPELELIGITKRFPGVLANDHVDLAVRSGEIRAIVGENGAGKSTLVSILFGLFKPDEGAIRIRGDSVDFSSPLDAMRAGLGMVFQHFQLFDSLTAAENVVFNHEPSWLGGLANDRKGANEIVGGLAKQYGLDVNPTTRVDDLSVGERQRVEILKALYRDAHILILDEPTSVLTPQETGALFEVLQRLKQDGRTILFITHKLREVMAISDRATVMRNGRVVAEVETSATSPAELSHHMTGREVDLGVRPPARTAGDVVLDVDRVIVTDDLGVRRVNNVTFTVRAGEILGVAGVAGNGQEDLLQTIAGLTQTSSGTISVGGRQITQMPVSERRRGLIAYVPEDRHAVGSAEQASVSGNLLLGYQRRPSLQRRGWLRQKAVRDHATRLISDYRVSVPSAEVSASYLSGGNLQKVVIARELGHEAALLIAEQPTRGVDIGSIEFIHRQLVEYRDRGAAVLLISAELDELMKLSTRLVVMYGGELVAELDPTNTTQSEVGLYMTGAAAT